MNGVWVWPDDAPNYFTPSDAIDDPADREPIYCDAQRQLTCVRYWGLGANVSCADIGQQRFSPYGNAYHGGPDLLVPIDVS